MNINSTTGKIQWTPNYKFKGKNNVGVKAVDSKRGYGTQYFNLYVVDELSDAKFTSDVISGEAQLTVQFTDQSAGDISSWAWDFGNGGTSDLKNPAVTYSLKHEITRSLSL